MPIPGASSASGVLHFSPGRIDWPTLELKKSSNALTGRSWPKGPRGTLVGNFACLDLAVCEGGLAMCARFLDGPTRASNGGNSRCVNPSGGRGILVAGVATGEYPYTTLRFRASSGPQAGILAAAAASLFRGSLDGIAGCAGRLAPIPSILLSRRSLALNDQLPPGETRKGGPSEASTHDAARCTAVAAPSRRTQGQAGPPRRARRFLVNHFREHAESIAPGVAPGRKATATPGAF